MNTVDPPYATIRHEQPPIQSTQIFPVKALQFEPLVDDKPPVSDHDHFFGLTLNDFPLYLTSFKRPPDAFSGLYVRCVHYAT